MGGKKAKKKHKFLWEKKWPLVQIRRRRVGSFPSSLLGKTLCQRGDQKTGGRGGLWVYQPSSPCYTSSDALGHSKTEHVSVFRQGPGSSQVGSHWCWPKIRPRMRLADFIHRILGPWKGRALSVHPRDPTACQTHYYTCPVHSRGHTRMKWDYMWIISNYLQHGIKAIFEGTIEKALAFSIKTSIIITAIKC